MAAVRRSFWQGHGYIIGEALVRLGLFAVTACTETVEPFHRKLQPEELWLYKYPRTESYVPLEALVAICILLPTIVFMVAKFQLKGRADVGQGCLAFLLALGVNGIVTNLLKLAVGRIYSPSNSNEVTENLKLPRPDFMYRCFPDGRFNIDLDCTGDPQVIRDGRKSFPSGHSSFAFLSMGFIAFYMAGKLRCFVSDGRGKSWRLCLVMAPLFLAMSIAVSRTCDYHHHWQDVLIGGTIGLSLSYLCYRQYFPSLSSDKCASSYAHRSSSTEKDDLTAIKFV